jgi:hypothetical protein
MVFANSNVIGNTTLGSARVAHRKGARAAQNRAVPADATNSPEGGYSGNVPRPQADLHA